MKVYRIRVMVADDTELIADFEFSTDVNLLKEKMLPESVRLSLINQILDSIKQQKKER